MEHKHLRMESVIPDSLRRLLDEWSRAPPLPVQSAASIARLSTPLSAHALGHAPVDASFIIRNAGVVETSDAAACAPLKSALEAAPAAFSKSVQKRKRGDSSEDSNDERGCGERRLRLPLRQSALRSPCDLVMLGLYDNPSCIYDPYHFPLRVAPFRPSFSGMSSVRNPGYAFARAMQRSALTLFFLTALCGALAMRTAVCRLCVMMASDPMTRLRLDLGRQPPKQSCASLL